jgi:hypothetical protein
MVLVTGHMSLVPLFQVGLEKKAKESKEAAAQLYAKA